jgi:glycosyltransferase involved in cell wall biosynthesis
VSIIRISIIIPVYNTSKYLKQCIESVLSQEYKDYEIILVDDGSTDSSGDICDFYSSTYGFIMTIHKENGGLSDARNIGLKHAKGDFVLFIDSDDYISQGSLLSVQNTIEENSDVDVVFLEAIKVFPNGRTVPLRDGYRKEAIYNKSQDSVLEHLAELPKFPGSACTKLIKRSLIKNNNLFFEKNQLSEDIDWTIRLLITAKSFNYCPNYYYCYRQNRVGSITNTANIRNVKSLLGIIRKWSRNPKDQKENNDLQKYINAFLSYEYIMILLLYGSLKSKEKMIVKRDIKSYSWLLKVSESRKIKIVRLLFTFLGIETVSYMLFTYQKLRGI